MQHTQISISIKAQVSSSQLLPHPSWKWCLATLMLALSSTQVNNSFTLQTTSYNINKAMLSLSSLLALAPQSSMLWAVQLINSQTQWKNSRSKKPMVDFTTIFLSQDRTSTSWLDLNKGSTQLKLPMPKLSSWLRLSIPCMLWLTLWTISSKATTRTSSIRTTQSGLTQWILLGANSSGQTPWEESETLMLTTVWSSPKKTGSDWTACAPWDVTSPMRFITSSTSLTQQALSFKASSQEPSTTWMYSDSSELSQIKKRKSYLMSQWSSSLNSTAAPLSPKDLCSLSLDCWLQA